MTYSVKIIDGNPTIIHTMIVHEFAIGDVDDPVSYAAEPMRKWQDSEVGRWVFEHSVETPQWNSYLDFGMYATKFCITVKLKEQDLVYYTLKWG